MAKKNKTQPKAQPKRPAPPAGSVDVADDLMLDMEGSPPDKDEIVFRIGLDGTMTSFPATELDPKDW